MAGYRFWSSWAPVFIPAVLFCSSCTAPDIEQANELLQAGDFLSARAICTEVLDRHPADFSAQYCMGMTYGAEAMHKTDLGLPCPDKWYKAIYHMTVAANLGQEREVERTLAILHFNLGSHFKKNGDIPAAIARLQQAVSYDSTLLKAVNLLGALYHQRNELNRARRCYRKVVEIDPEFASGHFNLGAVAWAQGDFAAATRHFGTAAELQPDNHHFRRWQHQAAARTGEDG